MLYVDSLTWTFYVTGAGTLALLVSGVLVLVRGLRARGTGKSSVTDSPSDVALRTTTRPPDGDDAAQPPDR